MPDVTAYAYALPAVNDGSPWAGLTCDTVTDPLGHATKTYRDPTGRLAVTRYADGSFTEAVTGPAGVPLTAAVNVGGGQAFTPTAVDVPAGGTETVTFNPRLLSDPAYGGGPTPVRATYRVTDAAGHLTDVYEPAVGGVAPHTHYGYDASGNETVQVTAAEQAAYAAWLAGPRTAPFAGGTTWTYDAQGHELSRTLPDSTPAVPEVERYTYDGHGNVYVHTDFDGNTAAYAYVPAGPQAGQVDHVDYARRPGTPATATNGDQTVAYHYDPQGRTVQVDNPAADGTTHDGYDPTYGQLVREDTPEGTIWHVYDPRTGRLTETYTDYTETDYGYDPRGRLWTATVKTRATPTGTWSAPRTTTYAYDAAGNKVSETLPDGTATVYAYDGLNRLTLETIRRGTTDMETLDYDQVRVTSGPKDPTLRLNADGTRGGVVDTTYAADGVTVTSTKTFRWTYDADGRLQSEALTASDATLNYSDAYGYDLAGNHVLDLHTGKAHGDVSAGTATYAYAYNGDDQLTASGPDLNNDRVPDPATATAYQYDRNGSQTLATAPDGSTTAYDYDVRSKMAAVRLNGSATPKATYVYDDAGDRVRQTTDGTTVYYLTDEGNPTGYAQPVEERPGATDAPTLTYLIGDRVYGQADAAGRPTYYLVDGHGSTIALRAVPTTGAITTVQLAYTAYGDALNFSAVTVGSAHLFGGDAMYDPASGLYLHGDGTRGRDGFRFIEADDEGYSNDAVPLGGNRFLYVNANPLFGEDPSGHIEVIGQLTVAQLGRSVLNIGIILAGLGAIGYIESAIFHHGALSQPPVGLPPSVVGIPAPAAMNSISADTASSTSTQVNCLRWAFNYSGQISRDPDLSYGAAAGLYPLGTNIKKVDANPKLYYKALNAWLSAPTSPIRGYPTNINSPVPVGWHKVIAYSANQAAGFLPDFHFQTQDSDGQWSEKDGDWDAAAAKPFQVHLYPFGAMTFVGCWAINTPPRNRVVK